MTERWRDMPKLYIVTLFEIHRTPQEFTADILAHSAEDAITQARLRFHSAQIYGVAPQAIDMRKPPRGVDACGCVAVRNKGD